MYKNDINALRRDIDALSISDEETVQEIRDTYQRKRYILDPHTAVGVAAARKRQSSRGVPGQIIVTATAHPAKFRDTIRQAIGIEVTMPPSLAEAMTRQKQSIRIRSDFMQFRDLLLA